MRRTIVLGTLLVLLGSGAIWYGALRSDPAPAAFEEAADRVAAGERAAARVEAKWNTPATRERSAVDQPVRDARGELPAVLEDPAFLAELCTVTGRVVDVEGESVADLDVAVHRVGHGLDLPGVGPAGAALTAMDGVAGRTDEDGLFTVGGLWPGFRGVSIELSDRRGRRQTHVHSARAGGQGVWPVVRRVDVGVIFWLAAARIVGRVAGPDGEPLAGARVRLVFDVFNGRGDAANDPARLVVGGDGHVGKAPATYPGKPSARNVPVETRTGADGRFAFGPISQGAYLLDVWAEGAYPRAETRVSLAGGETRDVGTLEVAAGYTVRGRVVDGDGSPAGGVELVAAPAPPVQTVDAYALPPMLRVSHWGGAYRENAMAAPVGRSRADGTFEVAGLPSELVTIGARRGADRPWTIANRHPVGEPLELRLCDEVTLAVTVLGPDGRAVGGAELAMAPSTAPGVQVYGRSALVPLPAMELSLDERVRWTGAGTARIDGLAPTAHWIAAWRDGVGAALAQVDLQRVGTVTLGLEPGRLAHVVVLDGRGAPVAGARLATRPPDVFGSAHRMWGFTGRDGCFTVPCISGDRFVLSVEHPSHRPRAVTLEVPVAEQTIVVLGQNGRVTGEVLVGGTALEDPAAWQITLIPVGAFPSAGRPVALLDGGAFEVRDVPPGRYSFFVQRGPSGGVPEDGSVRWTVTAPDVLELAPGESARVRMEIAPADGIDPRGRATVAGSVAGDRSGATGLQVVLLPGTPGMPAAPVQPDGSFELELPTGRRTLALFGGFDGERRELWRRQLTLHDGERATATIELVALARVSGVVRGVAGGAPSQLVIARSAENRAGTRTATDGTFAFERLWPGTYTFEARSPDRLRGAVVGPIDVAEGGRIDGLDLALVPCLSVSGDLPAAVRARILTPIYSVVLRGAVESSAGVTEHGRFLFRDVLPGRYRLLVVGPYAGEHRAVLLTHREDVVVGRDGLQDVVFDSLDQGR